MIPKRQQDLIIQNLRSISSEVRLRSVRQISNLSLSQDEKIKLLTQMLEDSEEEIRTAAKNILSDLGGSVPPVSSASQAVVPDATALEGMPCPSDADALPALQMAAPETVPLVPPVPPATSEKLPDLSDDVPDIDKSLLTAVADKPAPDRSRRSGGSLVIEAPFLDEQVDPSLPDPEKLKSIPELLDHTRFLVKNRPPGHLTQLLWMSRQVHEEVALTALQGLLTIKDPRIP
ncbi:MAG TPA: hypothetical protein PKM25_11790, partial [Candidatus Ozemobacteraceae bacterium]|nr:hypothetical protein [Candidatus Ozemobacteraceae bacterium]